VRVRDFAIDHLLAFAQDHRCSGQLGPSVPRAPGLNLDARDSRIVRVALDIERHLKIGPRLRDFEPVQELLGRRRSQRERRRPPPSLDQLRPQRKDQAVELFAPRAGAPRRCRQERQVRPRIRRGPIVGGYCQVFHRDKVGVETEAVGAGGQVNQQRALLVCGASRATRHILGEQSSALGTAQRVPQVKLEQLGKRLDASLAALARGDVA
jgi:hypothetical protein